MADITLLDVVKIAYTWAPILMNVIMIIFGVMTLTGRNKALRILGVWTILLPVSGFFQSAARYFTLMYGAGMLPEDFFSSGTYSSILTVTGIIGFALSISHLVLRWLYTRKSYGTGKGILITVLVLTCVSPVLLIIVNKVLHDQLSDMQAATAYGGSVSLIFTIAITSIFMVVFLRNRSKEKYIPAFWVFHLLNIVSNAINYLLYLAVLKNTDNDNFILLYMFICILLGFILPSAAFYLFRASRVSVNEDREG